MGVRVDRDRCFGFGRCVDLVPELFELDEDGKSTVTATVDVGDPDRVALAVWSCPRQALSLVDDNGQEIELDGTQFTTPR